MKKTLLFFIFCLPIACAESPVGLTVDEYYLSGGAFAITEFDEGNVSIKKYYSSVDSQIQKGPEIHFDEVGKVKKWLWHDVEYSKDFERKYPNYVIYYDNEGRYIKSGGSPFLTIYELEDSAVIFQLVDPPNYKPFFVLIDSLNNLQLKKYFREPGLTDSIAWVTIPFPLNEPKHNYTAWYYLLDENNIRVDSNSIKLSDSNDSKFITEFIGSPKSDKSKKKNLRRL